MDVNSWNLAARDLAKKISFTFKGSFRGFWLLLLVCTGNPLLQPKIIIKKKGEKNCRESKIITPTTKKGKYEEYFVVVVFGMDYKFITLVFM